MMGAHHAACGAAAWVAISSSAPYALGIHEQGSFAVAAGALICAGAALLPDADHPDATIAHSLPPLSTGVAAGVGAIAGGHRQGTHSLAGATLLTAGASAAGTIDIAAPWATWIPDGTLAIGAGVVGLLLSAFALKALKLTRGWALSWLVSLIFAAFITLVAPSGWSWLTWAVGTGVIVHLIGDMLTAGGVPLLWPAPWRTALPVLGRTGSWQEWVFAIPVSLYALWGVGDALWNASWSALAEPARQWVAGFAG